MKRFYVSGRAAILALVCVGLVGCGQEVLDFRNAELVNGKLYKRDANEPFSGKVTNVPNDVILAKREGMYRFSYGLSSLLPVNDQIELSKMQMDYAGGLISTLMIKRSESFCAAKVVEGLLDGEAVCTKSDGGTKTYVMNFKAGTLSGEFLYFDPSGGEHLMSTVKFKNGMPDGKQEVFSLKTRQRIKVYPWVDGVLQGEEEAYDENTGTRTGVATYVDNKLEGEVLHHTPDGKQLLYKVTFSGGKRNGVEEHYSPSGQLLKRGYWENGQENGLFETWNEQGQLVETRYWTNGTRGELGSTRPVVRRMGWSTCLDLWKEEFYQERGAGARIELEQYSKWERSCEHGRTLSTYETFYPCLDGWTEAFRKANGPDALVNADQLETWGNWCKMGKEPA